MTDFLTVIAEIGTVALVGGVGWIGRQMYGLKIEFAKHSTGADLALKYLAEKVEDLDARFREHERASHPA